MSLTFISILETYLPDCHLSRPWKEQNPQDTTRAMWDLALVEAYLQPKFSTIVTAYTPPENKKRKLKVFIAINKQKLYDDFWAALKK